MVRLHGAEDERLGPKAPACTGQTSWLRRTRYRPVISDGSPRLRHRACRESIDFQTVTLSTEVQVSCHDRWVRHEALCNRVEVRDLHRQAVAAAWLKQGAA